MATIYPDFPAYVVTLVEGYSDGFDPGVITTPTERGLARSRIVNSRVIKNVNVTLSFATSQESEDFETWYFNTIKRIGWFNWLDFRTRTTRIARIKNGALGELVPVSGDFSYSRRTATLEFLR